MDVAVTAMWFEWANFIHLTHIKVQCEQVHSWKKWELEAGLDDNNCADQGKSVARKPPNF